MHLRGERVARSSVKTPRGLRTRMTRMGACDAALAALDRAALEYAAP
jgi:hypothetical protein